jgi:phosphatidate cytidylyltransferase
MPSESITAVNGVTAPPAQGNASAEVLRRVLSGAVLALAALAAAYFGPPYFTLLVLAGAWLLAFEWGTVCGGGRLGGTAWLLFPAVAASALPAAGVPAVSALAVVGLGAAAVLAAARLARQPNAAWLAAGVLYIGAPATALIWLRGGDAAGQAFVLWLFGVVWASDIGAYVCGRTIGGPRLAPRISPKKTWAGVGGGLAAACLFSAAVAALGGVPFRLVAVAAGLAVAGMAGDLLESAVKRRFGIKDMSHLIPGHGGLFDRVDSLLAAAPCAALLVSAFGGAISPWH